MDEEYVEQVLSLVEQIPPGRAMSYGSIADLLGRGGPRQVGRCMALHGGGVPWWRVVRTDGSLPPSHQGAAIEHYRAEGTPLTNVDDVRSTRIDMGRAAWDPESVQSTAPEESGRDSGRP